jgi:hypothetical protein
MEQRVEEMEVKLKILSVRQDIVKKTIWKMKKDEDKRYYECCICMDEEIGRIFLPCKHAVCCISCSKQISSCPICTSEIDEFVDFII